MKHSHAHHKSSLGKLFSKQLASALAAALFLGLALAAPLRVSAAQTTVIDFEALYEHVARQSYSAGELVDESNIALPHTLSGRDEADAPLTIEIVEWQSTPAFDPNEAGQYTFAPVLPEGYVPGEGVTVPTIRVEIRAEDPGPIITVGDFEISRTGTSGNPTAGVDYAYESGVLTILSATPMKIKNLTPATPTTDCIVINSGATANITLAGVNISASGNSPVDIAAGASVNLTLEGDNILVAAYDFAALHVPEGAALTITADSNGSLTATAKYTGAGIGGSNGGSGGNITISGAYTVVAAKSNNGYDLGGGDNSSGYGGGGNLTVSGGATLHMLANGTNATMAASLGKCTIADASNAGRDANWAGNIAGVYSHLSVTDGLAAYGDARDPAQASYWAPEIVRDGVQVELEAQVPEGKTFVKWNSTATAIHFYDANSANTGFIMPVGDVAVTAECVGASPGITGPAAMTVGPGYAATSAGPYTITGTAPVTVTKTFGDAKITWNDTDKKLDIAAGLASGSYLVTLTARNGIAPDATLAFTLTVTDAINHDPINPPNPNTPLPLDTDAVLSFHGAYKNLAAVRLNGVTLTQTPTSATGADLSGWQGFAPTLGKAESGSVVVTLYKEFLRTLPNGKYTLEVAFNDGGVVSSGNLDFTVQQQTPAPTPAPTVPQTGDGSNMPLWFGLGGSALLALAGLWLARRRAVKQRG